MSERLSGAFHRREAARFTRLAELSQEPDLKHKLGQIAARHQRIAAQIEAIENDDGGVDDGSRPNASKLGPEIYRLQFLDGDYFTATHDFEAGSDIEALTMAYTLLDACSDVCDRFELWRGSRVIARNADRRGPKHLPYLNEITAQMQRRVLLSEELLSNSQQAIAESRRMVMAAEQLRLKLTARG